LGKKKKPVWVEPTNTHLRMPIKYKRELMGIVTLQTGTEFLKVMCEDGKERASKVPGRLRKRIWLRENDVVIVQVWEYDEKKADIVFKYFPYQVKKLKAKGLLDKIELPE